MASTQQTTASEPFVVLSYGPSGVGKTTDMGYSFPCALFVAAPGALNSIESVCGYSPDRIAVDTLDDATKLVGEVGKSGKYSTMVIDDFSFLAEQTFASLEGKYTGFKLWGKLRDQVLAFRNQSRYAGVNVVMNAWEKGPKNNPDGTRTRGGPQLSGKLPEQISAMCDMVVRAVHEGQRQPWPTVYRCGNDPNWVMKDRFNVASVVDPAPMNLAELLRASGKVIPRHPAAANQEEQVEAVSQELMTNMNPATINAIYGALLQNSSIELARWTMRDAVDRAVIRSARQAASLMFVSETNPLLG